MYKIIYTASYVKKTKKFFKKHPQLISQYEKVLKLLEINPQHPSLRLHELQGKFKGIYSVSINLSYRLTLDLIIKDKKIIPLQIGSHEEVY